MPKRYQATSTNVEDYWQLFVNRRAYVLQSMRPHAESGRYYYFRPKAGKNGEAPSLAAETVRRHLEGDLTIGVYAMSPATQRCKWIAMDGDYKDSLKHLCELQWELQQQKVEAALEQSRRGAHLWIFGEQPLLARQCRLLISGLAQKLGIPVKGAGTAEGIEIFPKHDELKDGDFGNAIRSALMTRRGHRYLRAPIKSCACDPHVVRRDDNCVQFLRLPATFPDVSKKRFVCNKMQRFTRETRGSPTRRNNPNGLIHLLP